MTAALLLTVAVALPPAGAGQVQEVVAQAAEPTAEALAQSYFEFLQALQFEQSDPEAAVAALRRAIALTPREADLHAELAAVYADQGRAFDAVTAAEAALDIDPDHAGAHRIVGYVQSAVADNMPSPGDRSAMLDEAIRHFERSLATGPADLGVLYRLAGVYLMRSRPADAVTTINRFTARQPGYPDAWKLLAQARIELDDGPGAIEALEELVRLDPAVAGERETLARLYEREGRWSDAAEQWARRGDQVGADPELAPRIRLNRATALANGGDTGAALAIVEGVTAEFPSNASAWYLQSQIDLGAGRLDEAERAARQIAAVSPTDPRAVLSLADVAAARGDLDAVIALVTPRVEEPPPSDLTNGIHGRMAGTLAGALQEKGDFAAAVAVMEAASRRAPDDLDLVYNLGTAYERADRHDDAERTLRGLIARVPDHADALNYLGYMLADRNESLDEALRLVQRALALEPGNPSFLDSLGWTYFRLGRFDEAVAPLEQAAGVMTEASVVQAHLGDVYFQLKRYRDAASAYDRALAGDRTRVDTEDLTRKRDRARELAGR